MKIHDPCIITPRINEWAARHEDEIALVQDEIEESGGRCIEE